MSDLADILIDCDIDGYERDMRAGNKTALSLGGRRIDRHNSDQVDFLRHKILDLRGLRGEVSIWILEVEDDLATSCFLHALLNILIKLEAAAIGGRANLIRVCRRGAGERGDERKGAHGDRCNQPDR